ncbi:phosphatidylserine decarboxylase-domain-containing protein [Pisolithus orientalis]|uniref:phosphatidylserine decarboxylase-domain-containing protein n=1 Tax=Pisolithus orientalis TaxID=936130 RepID=UPI002223F970|nr:phosphatidylserine decarboxylase-domain-containing protein [Pisolithus orientalis]KAI6007776.1 phosphatidylserine decarboxylase-domain-containing protein [Pisolithus orientalis]
MPYHYYAGWLPKDPADLRKWLQVELRKNRLRYGQDPETGAVTPEKARQIYASLAEPVQRLQDYIERVPEVYMWFHQMFDQVPSSDDLKITDYREIMWLINRYIGEAPSFSSGPSGYVSGVMIYGILAPFCNTVAGFSAFVDKGVNECFKQIFLTWQAYLVTSASASDEAAGGAFRNVYVCDPDAEYWGFSSFDDFFTRAFQDDVRPVMNPDDLNIVTASCECAVDKFTYQVKKSDTFWIKGTPYSLEYMLNHDSRVDDFVGGTVFQGILSSLNYHRWHSPVSGTVVSASVVEGTYYAARLDNDTDPDVVSRSDDFISNIATRAIIFIQADSDDIGLMCFIGVGLGEVSTCQIDDGLEGTHVDKGDQIGMFRFGGSSHCLVFGPQAQVNAFVEAGDNVKLNTAILGVTSSTSG